MINISEFRISGLFGARDILLHLKGGCLIIVGPNGIGKSSVVNIFYLFISRQWSRLIEYKFDELSLTVNTETLTIRRDEISGLSDFTRLAQGLSASSRVGYLTNILLETGELERFLSSKLTPTARQSFSTLLRIPRTEVPMLQRNLIRRITPDTDLLSIPRVTLDKTLTELIAGRVLYLPTYRRIERDIREIFPDFEERLRHYANPTTPITSGRSAGHFVELVSFGMEDVKTNIDRRTQELRNYSLSQHNNLSAIYLRDVIHGRADQFATSEINSLTDNDISNILARVSETALSREDKTLLRDKVMSMQGKRKSEIITNDKFLAHYFTRLVAVHADISKKEQDIASFAEVCNQYLLPAKTITYDEINFTIKIFDDRGEELALSVLSSGEKQIISIFSHLYLEESPTQIVIIDEPELSLSVPWQKRFLPDIFESGRCSLLMAVTHSPFIYDNALRLNSVDLRRVTTARASS
jgi:ABC-type lipoprotein export system ATPase subunit